MFIHIEKNPVTDRLNLYAIDDTRYPEDPERILYIHSYDGVTATLIATNKTKQTILSIKVEDLHAVVNALKEQTNGR